MPDHPDLPEPVSAASSLGVEGAVAADQAVAHATGSGHHGPFHTHCENCEARLEGPWCHRCGQHDFEFHRSFRHVFWEALENFFHFEGKFFRNIVVLLFQPGRLTADFNAGKRAAQMPPFRLYIFVSLIFFFLVFAGVRPATSPVRFGPGSGIGVTREGRAILGTPANTTVAEPVPPPAAEPNVQATLREALKELEQERDPQRAVDRLRAAAERIEAAERDRPAGADHRAAGTPNVTMLGEDFSGALGAQAQRALTAEGQRQMVTSFFTALPKMLLFCLPLFALYTRVIFRQSGQVYLQHLVLALHYHTFIYLFVLFRDGWSFLVGLTGLGLNRWLVLAANLWLLVYPFLMVRRLFRTPWPGTIFRTLLLALAYGLTLVAAFFVTALVLFMML